MFWRMHLHKGWKLCTQFSKSYKAHCLYPNKDLKVYTLNWKILKCTVLFCGGAGEFGLLMEQVNMAWTKVIPFMEVIVMWGTGRHHFLVYESQPVKKLQYTLLRRYLTNKFIT